MLSKNKTKFPTMIIIILCTLATGCVQQEKQKSGSNKKVSVADENTLERNPVKLDIKQESVSSGRQDSEALRLQQCKKELDVLKTISPKLYAQQKQEFDRIMSGAAQYAGLRQDVNSETQGAVDALYRYKAARVCATISQSVLDSLSARGEHVQ